MSEGRVVIVLVHGGHAGAWVWDEVLPHLTLPAIAIDLPGHGSRPGDLATLTFSECVDAIVSDLPAERQFILVGHSLGAAVVLPLADQLADRVAHVVCLAGAVPRPGMSVVDSFPLLMRLASWFVLRLSGPTFAPDRHMSMRTLFNGLDPAQAAQACDRLTSESSALVQEPVLWSGRLRAPRTYMKCLRDRGPLSPRHQDQMATNLGADLRVVEIDACHYAMLDRAREVAAVLNQIAAEAKLSGSVSKGVDGT